MSLDELRDMIQQVADKGGPVGMWGDEVVAWGHPVHLSLTSEMCRSFLAGILRRDCLSRGAIFQHGGRIVNGEGWHVVWVFLEHETEPPAEATHYRDPLTAWLHAWLHAHSRGLVGRKVEAT